MSLRQLTAAWAHDCGTHIAKLVLLALADNANDAGACWPSITAIAKKTHLCRQTVLNRIADFEREGSLSVVRNGGKSNHYQLTIPVYPVDQSTGQTSLPGRPPPVYPVDPRQSTGWTAPVYPVDSNRNEPSVEPSIEPSTKGKRFVPPKLSEVAEFFSGLRHRTPKALAEAFCDHHEARGWKLKTGVMKNWQAAARTWHRNDAKYNPAPVSDELPDRTDEMSDATPNADRIRAMMAEIAEA